MDKLFYFCAMTVALLSLDCSVAFGQDDHISPDTFRRAARNGDLELVKLGIAAGIEVDAKSTYGATALFFACERGQEEVVAYLLEQGADPNIKDTFYKATPVSWSTMQDNQNITLNLLKYGGEFETVLMNAVSSSDFGFAKKIIELKSDQKGSLIKARDAALQIKDEEKRDKMVALFETLGLPDPVAVSQETKNLKRNDDKAGTTTDKAAADKTTSSDAGPEFVQSSPASLAADKKISSANWPGFRGVGSRGVAEGQKPPVSFQVAAAEEAESEAAESVAKSEKLLWETPIEGLGLSSPTIWQDRIFLTSAVTEGEAGELKTGLYGDVDSVEETQEYEFKLLCYSKSSGEKLWERTAHKSKPVVKRHAKSSHANPTVATDGKHVVAFFGSEGLYCYSSDGELIWKRDLGFLDSGWFYDRDYQWGFASSPTIYGDKLFVQCDIQTGSFIECMDLRTGEEVWRTDREEIPSWSSPTVHTFAGKTMVITNGTRSSRGYDAATGEVIWSMKGNSEIVVPTPNVAHGLIFIASGYAPIRPVYAIKPNAHGDISLGADQNENDGVEWGKKTGGPYMPTPIIYGDYLYTCANNGVLTCYVAKTGEQVYKKRLRAEGGQLAFTASPLAGDGHLYFTAEDGRVLVVKAGPEYEIVAINELNESVLATPAISEGAMFFRTQNSLIAVGQRITD